jgi:hypothetical protein
MNNEAKAGVSAPALAVIRTAEAAQTLNLIMRFSAVTFHQENHSDLPQLPHRM